MLLSLSCKKLTGPKAVRASGSRPSARRLPASPVCTDSRSAEFIEVESGKGADALELRPQPFLRAVVGLNVGLSGLEVADCQQCLGATLRHLAAAQFDRPIE